MKKMVLLQSIGDETGIGCKMLDVRCRQRKTQDACFRMQEKKKKRDFIARNSNIFSLPFREFARGSLLFYFLRKMRNVRPKTVLSPFSNRLHIMIAAGLLAVFISMGAAATLIDFETDNSFVLGVEDFVYAGDMGGTLTSGNAVLKGYHYTNPWDFWGGFVASNRTQIGAGDIFHQFTSAPGTDHTIGIGGTYAIGYEDWESGYGCLITFTDNQNVIGAWFTNNKWTSEYIAQYYDAEDYYRLIVTAYDTAMQNLDSKTIDMTDANDWRYVALNFENAHALGFKMESSDAFTPFYFCIDDIDVQVPEPAVLLTAFFGLLMIVRRKCRTQ